MFSNSDLMNDRTNGREFNPNLVMTSKPSRNKYGLLYRNIRYCKWSKR